MRKKILYFIKENKVLILLLLLALFFIAKLSDLPCVFTLKAVRYLFLQPQRGTYIYGALKLMENLSLAYIASLVFYLIIEFIPKQKKAKRAYQIIENELVSLFSNMSKLISILNSELKIDKDYKNIKLSDVEILDSLSVSNETKYYHNKIYIDGEYSSETEIYIQYYSELPKIINNILKRIDKIKNMPCIVDVDNRIIQILSEVESNGFVLQVQYLEKCVDNYELFKNIIRTNFGKNYYHFIQSLTKLYDFEFRKFTYKKYEMNNNEKEEYKKNIQEIIEKHPEIREKQKAYLGIKRVN